MTNRKPGSTPGEQAGAARAVTTVPEPEAFLEEAAQEPQRTLLMDYIQTIQLLRDKKRFTFRDIAEWLGKRGIETDHSAVYRAYLKAIPDRERHPDQNWSEVEEPGFGDEAVSVKKD